jgi:hypothetical protein
MAYFHTVLVINKKTITFMTGLNSKTFFFDTSIGSLKPVLISPDPLRATLTFGGAPLLQAPTSQFE